MIVSSLSVSSSINVKQQDKLGADICALPPDHCSYFVLDKRFSCVTVHEFVSEDEKHHEAGRRFVFDLKF